jgi:hypothetical protein
MLADFGVFSGAERSAAVVMKGAEVILPDASCGLVAQKFLNMKRSATVTAAEISKDPRQPSRFEKKKNMASPDYRAERRLFRASIVRA